MAGKRKGNSQLYGIIALVAVVAVFVWAMVQILNQNKVTTESEARIRNNSRISNIPRNPTIGNNQICGRCDPVSDSGCPTNFTCVDLNSAKNNFPPEYRCVQVLNCNNPTLTPDCPPGFVYRNGVCKPAGTSSNCPPGWCEINGGCRPPGLGSCPTITPRPCIPSCIPPFTCQDGECN